MASVFASHSGHLRPLGYPGVRPVRHTLVRSGSSVRFLGSNRRLSVLHRRLLSSVDVHPSVDFSTIGFSSSSAPPPQQRRRFFYHRCPTLGKDVLATRSSTTSSSPALHLSTAALEPDRPVDGSSATSGFRSLFGGLEGSGWAAQVADWDPTDRELYCKLGDPRSGQRTELPGIAGSVGLGNTLFLQLFPLRKTVLSS